MKIESPSILASQVGDLDPDAAPAAARFSAWAPLEVGTFRIFQNLSEVEPVEPVKTVELVNILKFQSWLARNIQCPKRRCLDFHHTVLY